MKKDMHSETVFVVKVDIRLGKALYYNLSFDKCIGYICTDDINLYIF